MVGQTVNKPYLIWMSMTIAIGFVLLSYGFGYFNAFTDIMHKQYVDRGQVVIKDKSVFNSIISGLIPFGAIIGSVLVNFIVEKGRRYSLIIISTTFIFGTWITLVFNIYALILGRLVMGMWIGAYATLWPLFISEISPPHLSGFLGGFNQMGACWGLLVAFSVPFAMPLPGNIDTVNSNDWRYIFALPISFALLQLVLLIFVFKYESPLFYKKKQDLENFEMIISKLYIPERSAYLDSSDFDVELDEVKEDDSLIPKPPALSKEYEFP